MDREIYAFSEISKEDERRKDPAFLPFLPGLGPEERVYRFFRKVVSPSGKTYLTETGLAVFYPSDFYLVRADTGEIIGEGLFISYPSGVIVYGPTFCKARKEVGLGETLYPVYRNDLFTGTGGNE